MVAENILVIKLGALGDFVQALGPMASIRKHHPEAKISLLTTKPFVEFGQACGAFDHVICDTRPRVFDLSGWLSLRETLRSGHFTRVYDLQNNDRTSLYLRLFPNKERPEWVGAAHGASHQNKSPERTAGQAFDGHVQTLGLVGIHDIEIDTLNWIKADLSSFALKKPYALIVAGCAPQHPYKRWPSEYFADLCHDLVKKNIQPVLLGTKTETDINTKIKNLCDQSLDLTGQTSLFQIAALARGAKLAVGNDTGPMHIIAPTGCLCITLFSGRSNPARHAPKGAKVKVIQQQTLSDLKVENVVRIIEQD